MSERIRTMLSAFARDAGFGLRLLRKDWTFTLAAVVILGLAIGANTAIFSFVDTYVLRPLPYPDPDRLALLTGTRWGGTGAWVDGATWEALEEADSDLYRAAVYSGGTGTANLAVGDAATTVAMQRVGAGYFGTLGVPPAIGREFTPAEDIVDGPPVAVLSHALWQRIFNGDPGAVGDSVLLRGEPHTVVGILPEDFESSAQAEIWTPLRPSTRGEGGGTNYQVLLRLGPDVPYAEATGQLQAVASGMNEQIEDSNQHIQLGLTPLQIGDTQQLRTLLFLLSASVVAVLLVACVNVSGLLLARGARRGPEIATRMAIGGGRGAIVRQFVIESVVLALAGGVAGIVVARLALSGLSAMGSQVLGTWRPVGLDPRVLAGTAVISLLTALIFGIAPAVQASRMNIKDALGSSGGRSVAAGTHAWRKVLVVAEVALTVVLLVAAGLLLRTFLHLQGKEAGFDPTGIVTVSVSLQDARYETREDIQQLFTSGIERLRTQPGVRGATAALGLPYQRLLNMGFKPLDFEVEREYPLTNLVYVSPDYFDTLGIPVIEGREIDISDSADSARVVVVNQAFADMYLDGRPIGHTVATAGEERRIVGLVETVTQRGSWGGLAPVDGVPAMYVPVSQLGGDFFKLVHTWFAPAWIVRVDGEPGTAIASIETALEGVDPLLPLASTKLASELQADAIAMERFTAILVGTLAAAAMILSALGIYGLVASTVADRRRDIGIRLALGAGAWHAIRVAALPTIVLSLIGAVIGIGGSFAAGGALRSMLWGVAPDDPWTYAGVAGALVVAAAIASLIPASRAARVDPAQTLRVD